MIKPSITSLLFKAADCVPFGRATQTNDTLLLVDVRTTIASRRVSSALQSRLECAIKVNSLR